MENSPIYQTNETAINDRTHHLNAAECFKIYDLDALPKAEKITLAAMLTEGIEAPLPSDVATIAKTAETIMMQLYSYECVLVCAWESIPDTNGAADGRETVRVIAKLIAKEAEKLEMKVCAPLEKIAG